VELVAHVDEGIPMKTILLIMLKASSSFTVSLTIAPSFTLAHQTITSTAPYIMTKTNGVVSVYF
jgi:hypothetical protein